MRRKLYLFFIPAGIVLSVMGLWNMPKPDLDFSFVLQLTFAIITSPFFYGLFGILLFGMSLDAWQKEKRKRKRKKATLARPALQQKQKTRGTNKLTQTRHDNIWRIIRYDFEHHKSVPEMLYSLEKNHKIKISYDTLIRIIKERT